MLVNITRNARDRAHADDQKIKVEHAARGLGRSGPIIVAVAARFDELHAEATEAVMHLIRDFVGKTQISVTELGTAARSQLENLAGELVARIPFVGVQLATQQTQAKYRLIFQKRIDGALRDIEIGFIGGQNVAGTRADYSSERVSLVGNDGAGNARIIISHISR